MIHKLYASDKRFKAVEFKAGLNIILADKKKGAGDKDSRNGLGKTTLINIIHFCLGGNLQKKLFPISEIKDWIFFIDLDLCGQRVVAARSIEQPNIIKITGEISNLPRQPEKDEKEGYLFFKNDDWKYVLGKCLLNIPTSSRAKYVPTFRDTISYFIRNGKDAYSEPFAYLRSQKSYQRQIANAFLLGLNWQHAAVVQDLKDQNQAAVALAEAIDVGIIKSTGELEAERLRLQSDVDRDNEVLSSFKVHAEYQNIQTEANLLTTEIHKHTNEAFVLRKKLTRYEESIEQDIAPDASSVEKLYEEAGIVLGDGLKKSLDEAKSFHTTIVKNRQHFLNAEVINIKNELNAIEQETVEKSDKRAALMEVLQSHGALEEFTKLQDKQNIKRAVLEKLKGQISDIKNMVKKKKEIKAKRVELDTKIKRDYEEARPNWEKAVSLFNENSLALYEKPGDLIINLSEKAKVTENAYKFDVNIPRSNSEGVGKMKIFCFDLMLVELFSQKGLVDFLFHDSTMYDAVDTRQRAHAIELAHKKGLKHNFQYICAFNSDMLPREHFSDGFDVESFVRLQLNDKDSKDSLMGFRFE